MKSVWRHLRLWSTFLIRKDSSQRSTPALRLVASYFCPFAGSMIRQSLRASRLTASRTTLNYSAVSKVPRQACKAPSAFAPQATRYISSFPRKPEKIFKTVYEGLQHQVRHCSHRRAMCLKNADVPSGSVEAHREVLPTNVKPMHYNLTLEPDFDKFTYNGTVVIEYVL